MKNEPVPESTEEPPHLTAAWCQPLKVIPSSLRKTRSWGYVRELLAALRSIELGGMSALCESFRRSRTFEGLQYASTPEPLTIESANDEETWNSVPAG